MFGEPKLKLTNKDKQKIQARFYSKIEEFTAKSNEELLEIQKEKMSSTDKIALDNVIKNKMKQSIAEAKKAAESTPKEEINDRTTETIGERPEVLPEG